MAAASTRRPRRGRPPVTPAVDRMAGRPHGAGSGARSPRLGEPLSDAAPGGAGVPPRSSSGGTPGGVKTRLARAASPRAATGLASEGSDNHWILLANSRWRPISRSLAKMDSPGGRNSLSRATRANSPTESSLEQKVGLSHADAAFRNKNRQRLVRGRRRRAEACWTGRSTCGPSSGCVGSSRRTTRRSGCCGTPYYGGSPAVGPRVNGAAGLSSAS
jgi:hypothetical protein